MLLHGAGPRLVTTFFDLYALPTDFPGFAASSGSDPIARATELEDDLSSHIADDRLNPYIQVHEAEALVLACPDQLEVRHTGLGALALQAVAQEGGPEVVDDGPTTAPSKRLESWASAYSKTGDGPAIVASTDLSTIRQQCEHSNGWMSWLESW